MGSKSVKSVIICVIILALVLEQVKVEAKSCCKSTTARNCYNVCRLGTGSQQFCANLCGCIIISGTTCPSNYPKLNLLPNPDGAGLIEYCSLGCRSSVCNKMSADYGSNISMKIYVERCGDACDSLCVADVGNRVY